jgi:hypothetical protein
MVSLDKIEEIKQAFINSCIEGRPEKFKPYLALSAVSVAYPNKIRFYRSFKKFLYCAKAKCHTKGEWNLKIEDKKQFADHSTYSYAFYDEVHTFPRLTIFVIENSNGINLDIFPF